MILDAAKVSALSYRCWWLVVTRGGAPAEFRFLCVGRVGDESVERNPCPWDNSERLKGFLFPGSATSVALHASPVGVGGGRAKFCSVRPDRGGSAWLWTDKLT